MQPQDAGSGFDWWHAVSGAGGGALGTFLTWFWRAARVEPRMKLDISEAEKRVEEKILEAERRGEQRVEDMTEYFRESFAGLRQQMNDLGKDSFPRPEFNAFRNEHREDFNSLNTKIDRLITELLSRHK